MCKKVKRHKNDKDGRWLEENPSPEKLKKNRYKKELNNFIRRLFNKR